jgi:hypothetical protein
MATIQIQIPDALVPRVQQALTDTPDFTDSGLTAQAYVAKKMKDYLRDIVAAYEASKAHTAAQVKAVNDFAGP